MSIVQYIHSTRNQRGRPSDQSLLATEIAMNLAGHYSSQVPSSSSSSGCVAAPEGLSFPELWVPDVSVGGVSLPELALPELALPELSLPVLSFPEFPSSLLSSALHSSPLLSSPSFSLPLLSSALHSSPSPLLSFPLLPFPEPWFPALALPDSDGYDAVPVAPATPEGTEAVALLMGYGGCTDVGRGLFGVSAEVGPEGGAAVVESGVLVELEADVEA